MKQPRNAPLHRQIQPHGRDLERQQGGDGGDDPRAGQHEAQHHPFAVSSSGTA